MDELIKRKQSTNVVKELIIKNKGVNYEPNGVTKVGTKGICVAKKLERNSGMA